MLEYNDGISNLKKGQKKAKILNGYFLITDLLPASPFQTSNLPENIEKNEWDQKWKSETVRFTFIAASRLHRFLFAYRLNRYKKQVIAYRLDILIIIHNALRFGMRIRTSLCIHSWKWSFLLSCVELISFHSLIWTPKNLRLISSLAKLLS